MHASRNTVNGYLSKYLDQKVWDSGLGLSYWLIETLTRSLDSTPAPLRRLKGKGKPLILELGEKSVMLAWSYLIPCHRRRDWASLFGPVDSPG